MQLSAAERETLHDLWLLTANPIVVVVNVAEGAAVGEPSAAVRARAGQSGADVVVISARIESELAELDPADRGAFLADLGHRRAGPRPASPATPTACSTWSPSSPPARRRCAPGSSRRGLTALDAAGTIHTDFAKGFIRAEVSDAEDLLAAGSYNALREQGKQRLEGSDYVVRDGDVVHFRFNV